MAFKKWTSIEKFSDVVHTARLYDVTNTTFRGKIKLHGTCAGIRFEDGKLVPQKRTSDIDLENETDNAGFARWLEKVQCTITKNLEGLLIHGEWAGPGVQKGDAVASIPSKKFFVFSAEYNDVLVTKPKNLQTIVDQAFGSHEDIYVLPWLTDEMTVNLMSDTDCQQFLDKIVDYVDNEIGKEDPYIKETFGVSGSGEGIVFYGVDDDKEQWRKDYLFKVKTKAHTVVKEKARRETKPKPEGIDEFVETFFTENRFAQILNEQFDGKADIKQTGQFIGAVMQDVKKESVNELDAAEFDWKAVTKHGSQPIRAWFIDEASNF